MSNYTKEDYEKALLEITSKNLYPSNALKNVLSKFDGFDEDEDFIYKLYGINKSESVEKLLDRMSKIYTPVEEYGTEMRSINPTPDFMYGYHLVHTSKNIYSDKTVKSRLIIYKEGTVHHQHSRLPVGLDELMDFITKHEMSMMIKN